MIRICRLVYPTLLSFLLFLSGLDGLAQSDHGILKGQVLDASTHKVLAGVIVIGDPSDADHGRTMTAADGSYRLRLTAGIHVLHYGLPGFQRKLITQVDIRRDGVDDLTIWLSPLFLRASPGSSLRSPEDSIPQNDSSVKVTRVYESHLRQYNSRLGSNEVFDLVPVQQIDPGMDNNVTGILRRVNGLVVEENEGRGEQRTLQVSGMGARYNQVLLNGMVLNSFDPLTRAYPMDLLPAAAVEEVSLRRTANASLNGDFSGGSVRISTKDFPDRNFFYIQAGGGYSDGTNGKAFMGDRRGKWEALSFPGSIRDLPPNFPTTRSPGFFNQKNIQERIELSRTLQNNLAPVDHGKSGPDEQFLLGFGRILSLQKEKKIGIIGFISQSRTLRIEESTVQALPALAANPYPFADPGHPLITTGSTDREYRYASQLSAVLNASWVDGHSKISFSNFIGNQIVDSYTSRDQMNKPDEDTLAHSGIHTLSTQRTFINSVLSGEHALGAEGKFKLSWRAGYNYYRILQPDERSFLLRQDSSDGRKYEIAHPSAPAFSPNLSNPNVMDPNLTNSGRLWRSQSENDFEGAVSIMTPFNLFNRAQVVSGGIDIQSRNRKFHSDLLPTSGPGYYTLDSLLAPDRYYPGGLTISNYFTNFGGSYNAIYANNRGNYTGVANLGAAYLRFETHLSRWLALDLGGRLESSSQLVSNSEYDYISGYRNPQLNALDKNSHVNQVNFLPSAQLVYRLPDGLKFHTAYARTVNRPELQELTAYRYFDAATFLVRIGNPVLQTTSIDNYDAGIDWAPCAGASVSVSGYYKRLDQPIEYILSSYTSASLISRPYNLPPATVRGANIAFTVDLARMVSSRWLTGLSFFGSGDWLHSNVKGGPVRQTDPVPEHTLAGSPDYTFNAGLVLAQPAFPEITVLYNRTGDYIAALGSGSLTLLSNGNSVKAIPDYRVKGREQLDMRIGKHFFRSSLQLVAGVNNLLNNGYAQYQDLNGNKKFDAPLTVKTVTGQAGYYLGGTDSRPLYRQSQRTFYVTVSYLFK